MPGGEWEPGGKTGPFLLCRKVAAAPLQTRACSLACPAHPDAHQVFLGDVGRQRLEHLWQRLGLGAQDDDAAVAAKLGHLLGPRVAGVACRRTQQCQSISLPAAGACLGPVGLQGASAGAAAQRVGLTKDGADAQPLQRLPALPVLDAAADAAGAADLGLRQGAEAAAAGSAVCQ